MIQKIQLLIFLLFVPVLARAVGFCPMCTWTSNMGYTPFGMYPAPSFFPRAFPPFMAYGAMAYPNSFFGPGPMFGPYIAPGYYPGPSSQHIWGHGVAGKPNLYISGPEGTEVKIRIRMAQDSHLLAAVPIHGEAGWRGVIKQEHKLLSEGALYPYFFYDFRFNEDKLQDKAGLCLSRKELIPELVKILKAQGFLDSEMNDFAEYWTVKMPISNRYCVFPQETATLSQLAEIQVEPMPQRIQRVLIMVIPQEALNQKMQKFTREPRRKWAPTDSKESSPKSQTPGVEVREWGVSFLEKRK